MTGAGYLVLAEVSQMQWHLLSYHTTLVLPSQRPFTLRQALLPPATGGAKFWVGASAIAVRRHSLIPLVQLLYPVAEPSEILVLSIPPLSLPP